MKRNEFKDCVKLAMSEAFAPIAYNSPDWAIIQGCALDKARRFVTRELVASLIIQHCYTFAGTWDFAELGELEQYSKRFDLIN